MVKALSIYKLTQTMSITEFDRYCRGWSELKIIFSDDNQKRDFSSPAFMCMVFDEVVISRNPNAVHLRNSNGTLSVSGVEKIELYEGGVGDIVVLHCRLNGKLSKFKLIFD